MPFTTFYAFFFSFYTLSPKTAVAFCGDRIQQECYLGDTVYATCVRLYTGHSLRCQDTQVWGDGKEGKAGCTLAKTLAEEEAGD